MASATQVRTYLAHWFQLGKKLVWHNQESLLPQPVIQSDRFSPQFEACWQKIMSVEGKNCYLEGSRETIAELLSSEWDIDGCARCNMPIAIVESGIESLDCLCRDLDNWPNNELPTPRSPINNQTQLNKIRARLQIK
ncbi:hypothetical protein I4641_01240 [Waterburya agarophytonicola K14]|uniref:Uncharacterized protein n=1 Tax=Waterburya agarophytonicola KI4 TaxID=2874699 RepID=A0A964BLJ7_9CYAN|nr:hypothetical protein [Waterburya agarophytonicola]MCC0175605.1 hypothetical protein [Waterburya agarophytonicola KI4]